MTLEGLLAIRKSGKRPAHMVFLTLSPELSFDLPDAITIDTSDNFASVFNLQVCICFRADAIEDAFAIADRVLREVPKTLVLWEMDSGVLTNLLENGVREVTPAVPNTELAPIVRKLCN